MGTVTYIPDDPQRSCIIGIHITASLPLAEQNALREVLDTLIEVTKDLAPLAQMYPRVWGFRLTAIGSDGKELDEPEFFQAINDCPALWERSARYVRNIIRGDHRSFTTEGIALTDFLIQHYYIPHTKRYGRVPYDLEPDQLDDFVAAIVPRGKVKQAKLKEALQQTLFLATKERHRKRVGEERAGEMAKPGEMAQP